MYTKVRPMNRVQSHPTGVEMIQMNAAHLPARRSPHQRETRRLLRQQRVRARQHPRAA